MPKIRVRYGDSWASLNSQNPGIQSQNSGVRAPKAGMTLTYEDVGKGQFATMNDPLRSRYNPYAQPAPFTPTTYKPNGRYNPYNQPKPQVGGLSPDERNITSQGGRGTDVPDYTFAVKAQEAYAAAQEVLSGGGSSNVPKHKRGGDYVYRNWKGQKINNWRSMYGIRPANRNVFEDMSKSKWGGRTTQGVSWRI